MPPVPRATKLSAVKTPPADVEAAAAANRQDPMKYTPERRVMVV
jgi:hypothetical protein